MWLCKRIRKEITRRCKSKIIEYMNAKQSSLLAAMERKQTLRSGASDEILREVLHDVLVLDGKISEVEEKLIDASEEMRTLRVERRKMEVEERRVSDPAGVSVWTPRRYLELQVRKANLHLSEVENKGAVFALRPWFCEQCWRLAQKEEGGGAKRVGRHGRV